MTGSGATKRRRRPGVRPRESREGVGVWTPPEHERFLQAQRLFPKGPWKLVAQFVGTRSTRQTMTHAQKHRQKLQRRRRGLRRSRRDAKPAPAAPPTKETGRRRASGAQALARKPPLHVETEADKFIPADEIATPVPSPLVAARDPTAFLFDCGEVRFQDLLLMLSDRDTGAELCLPPFSLSMAVAPTADVAVPLMWEEPLQALDALDPLRGVPKAAPTEFQTQSEFPGLDDALDYIIRSM